MLFEEAFTVVRAASVHGGWCISDNSGHWKESHRVFSIIADIKTVDSEHMNQFNSSDRALLLAWHDSQKVDQPISRPTYSLKSALISSDRIVDYDEASVNPVFCM
jgi:hypothetical protein